MRLIRRTYWLVLKLLVVGVVNFYAVHLALYCSNQDSDAWFLSGITILVLLITTDFALLTRGITRRYINSESISGTHENRQTPPDAGTKP